MERDTGVECKRCASSGSDATTRFVNKNGCSISIGGRQNVNNKPKEGRFDPPHIHTPTKPRQLPVPCHSNPKPAR